MPQLTLSMIVKNEEANLAECLNSVTGIADEIVIVDTGSNDKTKSIAKSFGAKVYDFKWVNDFSKARNFALSKSTGNWILYLDADETLDINCIDEISSIINRDEKLSVSCVVESINEFNNSPVTMRYPRLFKNNPSIKFSGKVHEQIESSLVENSYTFVDSTIKIFHSGYNLPEDELKRKAERNLSILLDDYKIKPTGYLAFQIANSYTILKNRVVAAEYFSIALKCSSLEKEYRVISLANLAGFELEKLNFDNAEKHIEQGLKLKPLDPNFYFTAAQIYLKKEKFGSALSFIMHASELNENEISDSHKRIFIKIDSYKIIYLGIEISLAANNGSYFNHFCKKLDAKNNENLIINDFEESVILKSLINLRALKPKMLDSLLAYINNISLSTYLNILESIADPNITTKILAPIKTKFNDNELFHLTLGNAHLAMDDNKNGEAELRQALKVNPQNPAAYFFLISYYINTSQIIRVNELLEKAESIFRNNEVIQNKLKILEEKTKCLTA
ncbi:MAG: glycosyltransferase [Ignavibacteriae bacterium]|nr:glycosyltransferase [Ignavibacteriota bacterium]NOG97109.1 glycosyltransferase [Ignavibacteriota bacterium]